MPPISWGSSQDGQRVSVNSFIKQPALVRARMLSMFDQQFIADALLREGPPAPGGVVLYHESTPQFADDDAMIVEEWGEIPTTSGKLGTPTAAFTVTRALGILISERMRRRDDVGAVMIQMTQVRNTVVRAWERVFLNAILNNASVPTIGATAAWSSGSSKIRFDLAQAGLIVTEADVETSNGTGDNKFGFDPDTLVISNKTASDFLASDDIAKVFVGGDLASENLQYTGRMPKQFFGFDVVKSRQLPANKAILMQRKVVGGISDEEPLYVSELYQDSRPKRRWRSDVLRTSTVFIDQPKAACIITGI